MKFDKNLAAIHAYLCGDGYVIKNPSTQKHKYYYIGLRNTNAILLKDFQQRFKAVFNLEPRIVEGRSLIQNKEIYNFLTKEYSYYSYEWSFPQLSIENSKAWLRAFFDCEGWVENQPGKSRLIGLDCCNERGLKQVQEALRKLGIFSHVLKRKGRTLWRLTICGKGHLQKFQRQIDFLHPAKKELLQAAICSYLTYLWQIPGDKTDLLRFIERKGRAHKSRQEIRLLSIKRQNLINLQKALKEYSIGSRLLGPWKSSTSSQYYCLIIKEETIYGRRANTTKNGASARIKED